MGQPFATSADYGRRYDAAGFDSGLLNERLAAASRVVRSRSKGIDGRIESGAVDPELVVDVVCAMVHRTAPGEHLAGVATAQQSSGPFARTLTFANPNGDLYLTKGELRDLRGRPAQRAGSIDPSWRGED